MAEKYLAVRYQTHWLPCFDCHSINKIEVIRETPKKFSTCDGGYKDQKEALILKECSYHCLCDDWVTAQKWLFEQIEGDIRKQQSRIERAQKNIGDFRASQEIIMGLAE